LKSADQKFKITQNLLSLTNKDAIIKAFRSTKKHIEVNRFGRLILSFQKYEDKGI
jgi:hypothetical protein